MVKALLQWQSKVDSDNNLPITGLDLATAALQCPNHDSYLLSFLILYTWSLHVACYCTSTIAAVMWWHHKFAVKYFGLYGADFHK